MIRRQFLRFAAMAGASSIGVVPAIASKGDITVTYRVTGFSCVTCAAGLDVMLKRHVGVVWSQSDYVSARTTISFRPDLTDHKSLHKAISEMGFSAVEES